MCKISVALCTYNGEKYIYDQVISIISQSKKVDEIVICDDGSIDKTLEIIQRIKLQNDFNINIHVNDKQLGVTKNFEKCIKLCSGNFIFFSDQDDIWEANKVERFMDFFDSKNAHVFFSNANLISSKMEYANKKLINNDTIKKIKISDSAFKMILKENYVTGATMAINKEIIKISEQIPEEWIHDEWLATLSFFIGNTLYIDDCLIQYRIHENNQLGLFSGSYNDRFKRFMFVINDSKNYRKTQLDKYTRLKTSLEKINDDMINNERFIYFNDFFIFLEDQYKYVNSNFFIKISILYKNISRKKYKKFTSGFNSFFKDLILLFYKKN